MRRISDWLCLENGLSIIEDPKRGSKHYSKWMGDRKPSPYQETLRLPIDAALAQKPGDFENFLRLIGDFGYEIKQGKNLAFRADGQKKFTRLRSLGDGYGEQDIRDIIEGKRTLSSSRSKAAQREPQKVNLLVDIQAKLLTGKGPGYERWAKVFNLKQMAQTMNYLTENNLLEYAELEGKAAHATAYFNALSTQIKAAETRMAEIGNLKAHIINYSKTRGVYTAYRKSGYSKKFYAAHTDDILLHNAAKAAFDALPFKKIPTVKALQTEYETLLAEKKKAYSEYIIARKEMRALLTAKANVDRLLGPAPAMPERENER